ncbi:hybrid sensor histidine kinase/response regulator [Azorhizobium oxalatiphilum]|uniref:histidine kinase n=1 Tax=Azorhizobium oxalatiphilum TaxID=980631 RepID=A0A917BK78_9HYPH|nr:ATP-binding protein [Azorhizobium oxalatiphilum]GGF47279.1 hybrid sensor histidine kinase/response regulator [Azorhizobium oxalatiphilum]
MAAEQRIVRVRRQYNQWVVNETLEDYALRFTAKSARRMSAFRVANTALGAISFLALEAIGGAVTLSYGFTNAVAGILAVSLIIFLTGLPISYYAAKFGVDIDLLTRGAGFGYIGSTVTSLIYASFTFIFFAIEAAILALALEMCLGVPLAVGYVLSALVVVPLVTHGITFISRFQTWTQPLWLILHIVPLIWLIAHRGEEVQHWMDFNGIVGPKDGSFNLYALGGAATVVFALVAQIGEQVDFLRFLPRAQAGRNMKWWCGMLAAGPGWIIPGAFKMLVGSFLAYLALESGVPLDKAAEPTQMYLVAFSAMIPSHQAALLLMGVFVIVSQLKINVTNSYAGSIAWSNFFSRLTHSHPGRVVWLVFNVTIALLLMELGIYKVLNETLGLYAIVAIAWVAALVADLVVNKPLGLSPPTIEFKRAHLYDINPVGVGAVLAGAGVAVIAYSGGLGPLAQAFAPFIALIVSFLTAPAIAFATKGRYYTARKPKTEWRKGLVRCCICEHKYETEDMAHCPVYAGPICSLCCTLDARCHDRCKTDARMADQILGVLGAALPGRVVARLNSRVGHYLAIQSILALVIGGILAMIYFHARFESPAHGEAIKTTLWTLYFVLMIIVGVVAWLFVLAQESRRVAQEESQRQTTLLMREIEAHKRTDAKLQKAKEVAEAANLAKSRYVVGISHELRTPLNAILGYAQLLERDPTIPAHRRDAVRVVRRSSEHLSGLIDGLLDISKIEAGRLHLYRDEVRIRELLDQIVDMFRLQAKARGIDFIHVRSNRLPAVVHTDEKRLRQILINLLSNAIKFTAKGHVALRVSYRNQVAEFEIEDTGIGIAPEETGRIFEPFERGSRGGAFNAMGIGLGLTITKLLTEIMGGEISLRSVLDKGSTFRVRLLLSQVEGRDEAAPAELRISGYAGPARTVLVADDDAAHRDLMCEMLRPLGFIVFTAEDGLACLEMAGQTDPDLVLLDVSMPRLTGWEAAAALRTRVAPEARIIMISANAGEMGVRDAEPRHHDDACVKPVDLRALLEKIRVQLNLEWTTQQDAPDVPAVPPAPAKPPAASHLDELLKLGQIGYVRGIQAKLQALATESPEHEPFVREMNDIVRTFDLNRYMAVLEALRAHDA